MSLSPAAIVHQGNVAGGVIPDISSALGYKEHIGSACINPNGYTAGSFFIGADDGYFYCVTANIAAGDTITIGTNCVQTDVAAEIKSIKSDLTEKDIQITWQNFPGSPLNEKCKRDANNGMISTGRYNAITGITPNTMIKLGTVTKSEDRPSCYVTAPLFEQDANGTSMSYCGVVRLDPTGKIYAYFTKKPTWTAFFTLKWMY